MRPVLVGFVLMASVSLAAAAETLESVSPRDGVAQRFLLLKPEGPPLASLILFTGGDGNLKLSDDGRPGSGAGNFLVRTRARWAAQGFTVAVVDAPSDHAAEGLAGDFRGTPAHAQDMAAVIDFLRRQADVPVWLVGTSRGTTSAASVAIKQRDKVDGLVLTSSIDHGRGNLADFNLQRVTQPVLLVQHQRDECQESRLDNLQPVVDKLTAAQAKELIVVDGGNNRGDPCQPWAWHGYNGIEDQVVSRASAWIKGHLAR